MPPLQGGASPVPRVIALYDHIGYLCKLQVLVTCRQLSSCRQYKEGHCRKLEARCTGLEYRPFGFLAAISFPFNWAPSFGEFGTQEWRLWGRKFEEAGIPVRSCITHFIDMTSGV